MSTNNTLTDLLAAPLDPDWTIENLAEQVLRFIAAKTSSEEREFVIDTNTITDQQTHRLIRPLLACLAAKSAAESGTPVSLYGGHLSFGRTTSEGPVCIIGQFENRPDSVRLSMRRSGLQRENADAKSCATAAQGELCPPNESMHFTGPPT